MSENNSMDDKSIFRYRVKISVTGPAAWLAHLDLLRAVERAMRRAKLPLRYSEGFNPHPLISWGPAHPVGLHSLGEYFDVDFTRDPGRDWLEQINGLMPLGLAFEEAQEIALGLDSLMASINRADYYLEFQGLTQEAIAASCRSLLEKEQIMILRKSPKGDKTVNIRPGILDLQVKDNQVWAYCLMGQGGSPKPRELPEAIAPGAKISKLVRTGLANQTEK